uniref:Gfo/Idh/MocA-like oxidoreductase N-terminal domain-containing protein n=1 Tax=Rhizochromulina marina TaxID=1034831 RepID=A0A7S2WUR1_9STRA|mmetsp:Transcript_677/g.2139  ORF Transcript_677/g.2139 Transcript_677/m.2139 type:complete len:450 (+) Transcript_677:61-1410(+)
MSGDVPPLPSLMRQNTSGGGMASGEGAQGGGGGGGGDLGCLMVGTGEYTTGYVGGAAADSDKGAGVVGLVMFDLRRRGKVARLSMCGTNGSKFTGIRAHMQAAIGAVYDDMDLSFQSFPADGQRDPLAYREALAGMRPGDIATIFTPDDTHFDIAMACIERGLHVLVTKPIVKTLKDHLALYEAARKAGVLVAVEVHKRFDPIYVDARDRIQALGGLSYMYAYMSQPKHQLETFRAWAGKSSDISYYLNSHHIDFAEWALLGIARPVSVTSIASTGIAHAKDMPTEDAITLTVQWENLADKSLGHAVYTSSWVAPKSDVHSQQRFFYMGQRGEINVDQAHRGYNMSADGDGYRSINPLFMKYTPTDGMFSGQNGYGYVSFEKFLDAATAINQRKASVESFDSSLPTIGVTFATTAILEAGRLSLDSGGKSVAIHYDTPDSHVPARLEVV